VRKRTCDTQGRLQSWRKQVFTQFEPYERKGARRNICGGNYIPVTPTKKFNRPYAGLFFWIVGAKEYPWRASSSATLAKTSFCAV